IRFIGQVSSEVTLQVPVRAMFPYANEPHRDLIARRGLAQNTGGDEGGQRNSRRRATNELAPGNSFHRNFGASPVGTRPARVLNRLFTLGPLVPATHRPLANSYSFLRVLAGGERESGNILLSAPSYRCEPAAMTATTGMNAMSSAVYD